MGNNDELDPKEKNNPFEEEQTDFENYTSTNIQATSSLFGNLKNYFEDPKEKL